MDAETQIDVDISRWILEFLLRQPLDNGLLSSLLLALPLPNDNPSLKKTILLRRIESEVVSNGVVTEKTLQLLEQIEELNFQDGIFQPSDDLKAAYCAVAVYCSVKLLKNDNKSENFDAVKRIWSCKEGLVTEGLLNWKDKIEAAMKEESFREDLVKRSEEINAVEAVKVYVMEEKAKMGPSFLHVLAEALRREGDDAMWEVIGLRKCVESSDQQTQDLVDGDNNKEVEKANVLASPSGKLVVSKPLRVILSKASKGAKIAGINDSGAGPSGKKYEVLPTPEVKKVYGELESSSLELQVLVKDPLPGALSPADTGVSNIARGNMDHVPLQENLNSGSPSVALNAGIPQPSGGDVGTNCCVLQINAPKEILMWDDSVNRSPEDSAICQNILQPSPGKRAIFPLQKNDVEKLIKRRKIKRWSIVEEDTLRTGVEKYGKGNWKLILFAYRQVFVERTEVDLKDKWRNMTR